MSRDPPAYTGKAETGGFAPSHRLKKQSVSRFDGTKDNFVYPFLFRNVPADESRGSIEFFEHGCVTGTSEIGIEVLGDEVEE
jgi:hypothetical protein